MFGSMVSRCRDEARCRTTLSGQVGAATMLSRMAAKLPGQVRLPYGKQVGIVCHAEPVRAAAMNPATDAPYGTKWLAPQDRAEFPQETSLDTSEREAIG